MLFSAYKEVVKMQIAARTAVYSPEREDMGRIVFLAEVDRDDMLALIVEFRVIETKMLEFPDLQGTTIDLTVRDGELPKIIQNNRVIAHLSGEAAHYHRTNAARHYVEFCKKSKTHPPEP